MKTKILQLIAENPKTYHKLLKRDAELLKWVNDNSLIQSNKLTESIYSALHQVTNICQNGNVKKFDRISTGFFGCGPANVCKCTKDSISKSVSITKSNISQDIKDKSNIKRKATMIEKYGVGYNLQRQAVKEKLMTPKINSNNLSKLTSYEWLNEEYNNKKRTLTDIADELGIYYSTVGEYCIKHGFKIRRTTNYSMVERQICDFLKEHGILVETHNWSVLGNQELDIYLPQFKLAIEVDGLYWHSWNPAGGKVENKKRHIEKTMIAAKAEVQLLHITDYEWNTKQDIIKNILLSKIGKNLTIYARKTTLNNVTRLDEQKFLKNNHLQGYTASNMSYGLYYNAELVMILTIANPRFKNKYSEILRVCSKPGFTVVGGLSKLLKHAATVTGSLITYCDYDKSIGSAYEAAGMIKIKDPIPGYFWTDGNIVISRYKAQRKKLAQWLSTYDPSKTESENMFAAGYRRFSTCGNIKYLYKGVVNE